MTLAQVFAPSADNLTYPSIIQPEEELWWLLDQAAVRLETELLKSDRLLPLLCNVYDLYGMN